MRVDALAFIAKARCCHHVIRLIKAKQQVDACCDDSFAIDKATWLSRFGIGFVLDTLRIMPHTPVLGKDVRDLYRLTRLLYNPMVDWKAIAPEDPKYQYATQAIKDAGFNEAEPTIPEVGVDALA